MNYYPFHIGDYVSATRHLSWEEDAAYRRLLDTYYTTEKPLPTDLRACCRLVMATTEIQREAVRVVLEEFFSLTEEGWVNKRADEVIHDSKEKQQKQRDKAIKRWHKPEAELGIAPAMPLHKESDATASKNNADAMPPIPIPIPIPKEEKEKTSKKEIGAKAPAPDKPSPPKFDPLNVELPECVSSGAWSEWIAYRRQERMSVKQACIEAQLKNLSQWHSEGHDVNAIIRKAIAGSWKGLYPDKIPQARASPLGGTATADGSDDRRARIARLAAQVGVSAGAVNA